MDTPPLTSTPLWPLAVYFAAAVIIIGAMIGLSSILGQRHRERATGEPYESGIASTGSPRIRFDIAFYLVAVFFLIFDLEAAFLYAWAVAVPETGWRGYTAAMLFIGTLAAGLAYLWKLGALDGGRKDRTTRRDL